MALHQAFEQSASQFPDNLAVVEATGGEISYRALDALTNRLRDYLVQLGVKEGERVGLLLHKSIDSVATILGILKAGAAYVPVDATAPLSRAAVILSDCKVKAIVAEASSAEELEEQLAKFDHSAPILKLGELGGGNALGAALEEHSAKTVDSAEVAPDSLAYLLYTSGSTGKPKGVMLSHSAAEAAVAWYCDTYHPGPSDKLSSHAPFHFDLSIFDLYPAFKSGAAVVLIDEHLGKEPARLAEAIAETGITVWYSTPSILTMLVQSGALPKHDYSALKTVLFAGEVFPLRHLKHLVEAWPDPEYHNLYGPTETNVCTALHVSKEELKDRTETLSIGPVCAHLKAVVADVDGNALKPGEEGELCIAGPNILTGYWNLPERSKDAFFHFDGEPYYRTGDLVVEGEDAHFKFVGRRDRMVKKRGYRVELGEVENAMHQHPNIKEAAVVALSSDEGVTIVGHYSPIDGKRISAIKLKQFTSERIPVYMVPDRFQMHPELPKTSTDKINYQALTQ